jgi:predicted O-methyltransferase YrrM
MSSDPWAVLDTIRWEIGPVFGSEDLCILLYGIVRREKPQSLLELGTGLGVTSAWIARALKENGSGTLVTVDNGRHFSDPRTQFFLSALSEPTKEIVSWHKDLSYLEYLEAVFEAVDAQHHVQARISEILLNYSADEKFDFVFADFDHSPRMCLRLAAHILPRLSANGSLFIDSASTHMPSYLALERIVDCLNRGLIPEEFSALVDAPLLDALKDRLRKSRMTLTHLVENSQRNQNSTAWLRWVPVGLVPSFGAFMH